ncbi:MAG: tyrosine-type recombinase/integrase [Gemmatimonadales bacterium]
MAKRIGVALTLEQARSLICACREPVVHRIQDRRRKQGEQAWPPPPHLFLAVLVALHTGLRRGNTTRLRLSQLDLGQRKINIAAEEMKANADFVIPVHPELAEALTESLRGRGKLGPDELVLGREVKEITKSFKSALKRAGLPPIRWHDLRHTASTWWSERAPQAVKDALMGHAPVGVSGRYTHIPFETMKRVVDCIPRLLTAEPVPAQASAP